jgi:site-specific DNA-methyltransferase (adenine-specific)
METKINNSFTIYNEDCLKVLDQLPENSIDAIITDPPYEIGFMNKGWDSTGIAFQVETWKKALRVLKAGGHLLAFNHSRQFHRLAVAIEDAGFEIRDTIMWLYGSGFPKSLNIAKAIDKANGYEGKIIGQAKGSGSTGVNSVGNQQFVAKNENEDGTYNIRELSETAKQWEGWGTALKPAYEPIVLARKPIAENSIAENVLKHGVGGINIDECRVGFGNEKDSRVGTNASNGTDKGFWKKDGLEEVSMYKSNGRFPANVIHDNSEEVVNLFPEEAGGGSYSTGSIRKAAPENLYELGFAKKDFQQYAPDNYGDSGSAARFFYSAKANILDRDEGLDVAGIEEERSSPYGYNKGLNNVGEGMFKDRNSQKRNIHPTVKPTDLMAYLVRLISPKGATILDMFMGSGSTGKAVALENARNNSNYKFIGIELNKEYADIAIARISYAIKTLEEGYEETVIEGKKQLVKPISLFDE